MIELKEFRSIYIPLWLNIKNTSAQQRFNETLRNLHSTLIKYKVKARLDLNKIGIWFTFHSD